MTDFDPHGVIKRLAETEWECPTCEGSGIAYTSPQLGHRGVVCPDCQGAGRIIPFKALRVPCPCLSLLEYGTDGVNHWYDRGGCKECYLRMKHTACHACEGRGWVPEPDIRVACWEVHIPHPYICYSTTAEEELREAEAWLRAVCPLVVETED